MFCAVTNPEPDAATDFGVIEPPIVVRRVSVCRSEGPFLAGGLVGATCLGVAEGEGNGFGACVAGGAAPVEAADEQATRAPAANNASRTEVRRVTAPSMPGPDR